jgi:enterochelin esterase family protein
MLSVVEMLACPSCSCAMSSVYSESSGTAHEWLTWRRALHEFAPLLFQNVK